jgi:hypothetical protein
LLFTVILYAFLTFSAGWNIPGEKKPTDTQANSQQPTANSQQPTANSQQIPTVYLVFF